MTPREIISDEDFDYAVRIRRQIHQRPELGFDVDETAALVKDELDKVGIACTSRYGRNSIVADLGKGDKTLLLRADMDALPVTEKTGLPYASQIPGKMHACGHDAHTAMLLAAARILKKREAELPCRVRLAFQPSEECNESGAKVMVENGVLDGVDAVCCTHVDSGIECGRLGLRSGDFMAAYDIVTLVFHGKTSHATIPQKGIDALAMAVEAYEGINALAREAAGASRFVLAVCTMDGGTAHNIIPDRCEMKLTFRYFDVAFADELREKCLSLCERIAARYGGRFEPAWTRGAPPVHNDEGMTAYFRTLVEQEGGLETEDRPIRLSSEDFAWYQQKCPGMLFRCGVRNEQMGCTAAQHCNDFKMDEDGMRSAMAAFVLLAMKADAFIEAAGR